MNIDFEITPNVLDMGDDVRYPEWNRLIGDSVSMLVWLREAWDVIEQMKFKKSNPN
jgi:hypothetical protein